MILFISNLPFKIKEKALKDLFEEYGTVNDVSIVIDKITRQNKGFGFVDMPDDEQARMAIESLNDHEVMDRKIIVQKSAPKDKDVKGLAEKKGASPGPEDKLFLIKKKLLSRKKKPIVSFGDNNSDKKKIKKASKHKHPWQKR